MFSVLAHSTFLCHIKVMKRSRPRFRWLPAFLLSLMLALGYVGFRYLYPPQSADIFVIGQATPLEYGDTTVTGTLTKDSPLGEPGTYLLVLPDSQIIVLEINGLDALVGTKVTVTGILLPAASAIPMTMTVDSIGPAAI